MAIAGINLSTLPATGGQVHAFDDRHDHGTNRPPLQINHLGQFPAAMISFSLASGASLGEAVDSIEKAEQEIDMPVSVMTSFQGAALGFPCFARQRIAAHSRSHYYCLYRPRRFVRKLYPPDYHPFDFAFGERRRPARADPFCGDGSRTSSPLSALFFSSAL